MKRFRLKYFIRNIPFFISLCALLALHTANLSDVIRDVVVLAAVAPFACTRPLRITRRERRLPLDAMVLAVLLALAYVNGFYPAMEPSGTLASAAAHLGLTSHQLLVILCALGGAGCIYTLVVLLSFAFQYIPSSVSRPPSKEDTPGKLTAPELLFCFVTAFAALTLCSKSSPLYPMNDWVDPNCFFTVGRAMLEGLFPYRDLYEQKGPLLYLLHALAALISNRSFFGVYLMEIVTAFFFLAISYKTMKLFREQVWIGWIPVMAALIYSSEVFCQGDSVEEFCLPLIAYCLFCGLKSVRTGQDISDREALIIGITSGCVLWMKFTILGVYIGWFVAYAIIRCKNGALPGVFKTVGRIAAGVLVTTLPIQLFFYLNGALPDLWRVYFYDNIFSYGGLDSSPIPVIILKVYFYIRKKDPLQLLMLLLGVVLLYRKKQSKALLLWLTSLLGLYFFIYCGGQNHPYYALPLWSFLSMGMLLLDDGIRALGCRSFRQYRIPQRAALSVICLGSVLWMYTQSMNTYWIGTPQSEMPQYQFAEIINREKNPTLLNYGFLDGGFYLAADVTPNCLYFAQLNLPIPEIHATQKYYVDNGLVDFVVTKEWAPELALYDCILEVPLKNTDLDDQIYRLYRLNTLE